MEKEITTATVEGTKKVEINVSPDVPINDSANATTTTAAHVIITFRQHELQSQLTRIVKQQKEIMTEISKLFDGEKQAPVLWTQNQLDVELSTVQRICFVDIQQCIEYARRWGLLNDTIALSELRMSVLTQLVEVLRTAPESLLRCHSIDTKP